MRQLGHVVERLVATSAEGETITADDIYKALPAATLTGATSQVPIIFQLSDSLDDFLDRTMPGLYDQLLAKTGSHSTTVRNFVPTADGVTVEEITTNAFPLASAVAAAEAAFTVTT